MPLVLRDMVSRRINIRRDVDLVGFIYAILVMSRSARSVERLMALLEFNVLL